MVPNKNSFLLIVGVLIFILMNALGGCATLDSSSNGENIEEDALGDPRRDPLGPRTLTFVNLCKQTIYVAAFGNNDPSGTEMTTGTCPLSTPAGSPCRCKGDSDCKANEYCNQVPNRTGIACSKDSDCKTSEGQFCDKTFDPNQPVCSWRLCNYVPADPNHLAKEVQPTISCTDNSPCAEGQWCNTFTSTCFSLPSDGGNGWKMEQGGNNFVFTLPEPWGGRFWARTGCDDSTFICDTGQCSGCVKNGQHQSGECTATDLPPALHCVTTGKDPATLAEVTMQNFKSGDFYDVSMVDSGNVGIMMEVDSSTYDMPNNPNGVDKNSSCTKDSDCKPLFGSFIWRCDTNLGKCVNPFTCGSPGCNDTNGCAANGIQQGLLDHCPWDPSTDLAVPEGICRKPLEVRAGGNYVGCNTPKAACAQSNPPSGLDCGTTAKDLYNCTGTNAQSCFTAGAGGNCCGCPSWADTIAMGSCNNTNGNWTTQVEPLITAFNTACPTAYSFPFDDAIKLFSCQAKDSSTSLNYTITFCPQN